jgi:hypothetical protein
VERLVSINLARQFLADHQDESMRVCFMKRRQRTR